MATDGGIHFPPGQRRDKPSFEPPPWERDRFEELAKRKQEPEAGAPSDEADVAAELVAQAAAPAEDSRVSEEEQGSKTEPATGSAEGEAANPTLDPQHFEILMRGLRSEEPRPQEAYWKVSVAAGVFISFIGLMVTTWGFVTLVSSKKVGPSAVFIGFVPLVLGVVFIAAGAWVVFRSLRQQGVL